MFRDARNMARLPFLAAPFASAIPRPGWRRPGPRRRTGCCKARFPTVTELPQCSISGISIVNNDPNLKPEKILAGEHAAWTLAGRYSDKNGSLFGGQSKFFIVDAKFDYRFDPRFSVSVGIDNLTDKNDYTYPQRSCVIQAKGCFE